jgi:hypothetical protein
MEAHVTTTPTADELRELASNPWNDNDMIALRAALPALLDRIEAMEGALREANSTIVAFAGPWAGVYAREHGLAAGELHPTHYDILKQAGARMDEFRPATLNPGASNG